MIQVSNLALFYGNTKIFDELSFNINQGDRIALIGKNGAGKTSLLNIIAGKSKASSGTIALQKWVNIAYLPQEIMKAPELSVWDRTMEAFREINAMEQQIADLEQEISEVTNTDDPVYLKKLDSLTFLHQKIQYHEAGRREERAEKVLLGLGFLREEFQKPCVELSGGWLMRVELAMMILKDPDVLLLDEPTNHLDITSILWLEKYLKDFNGAIILVSHDRRFLNTVTNRTIELVWGRIYDFAASYDIFIQLREERYESQLNAAKNQEKLYEQQERFIERFRAKSSKARQAKSKLRHLEKIEKPVFDPLESKSINFTFPDHERSGNEVIRIRGLRKQYGNHLVFENMDMDIGRAERIAFVGKNGEGKTSLVKIIVGDEDIQAGSLQTGHNVKIAYYAQFHENQLNDDLTVLDTLWMKARGEWANIGKIRSLLAAFLFTKDDLDKKVSVLSGGEKSRLVLAALLLEPGNLLILDEPTNHLDMSSKEVLKKALIRYKGTLIIVSHDRDFLKGISEKSMEFKNKSVAEHVGDIDVFLEKYQAENFRDFEEKTWIKGRSSQSKQKKEVLDSAGNTYEKRKSLERELRMHRKAILKTEEDIAVLEKKIFEIQDALSDPQVVSNFEKLRELTSLLKKHQTQMEKLWSEWEKQNLKLEKLDAEKKKLDNNTNQELF
jgi:ATP-binding cassette, subfamily F, member 3